MALLVSRSRSISDAAKIIQRQLATGERHRDPAPSGRTAEVEVPEGNRRVSVCGQAQTEQFSAAVQVPQPQGSIATDSGQLLAVRAEDGTVDRLLVADQTVQQP